MSPVGIFGGTFDPIHYGHLRTAFELLEALRFDAIRFIPGGDPPHRGATEASAELRLQMVIAATAGEPRFVVDDREIRRTGPSYTVDTLVSLRREFSEVPLGLIIGMDAFLGLATWHRWVELLDHAHIIVARRPGWLAPDSGPVGELFAERRTERVEDLHAQRAGRIHIRTVTQLDIASTAIRKLVANGEDPRFLVPDAVRGLIQGSGCYARERQA